MKNIPTAQGTAHKEFKKELFKRAGFKKVHEELAFEFKIMDALIRARIEKEFTQLELAQKIGVAQSALARFETCRTNPTLSFLKKVTSGLGLRLLVK